MCQKESLVTAVLALPSQTRGQPVSDSADSQPSKELEPVEIPDQSVCYHFLLGQSLYAASSLILIIKGVRDILYMSHVTQTHKTLTHWREEKGWSKIWMPVSKLPKNFHS